MKAGLLPYLVLGLALVARFGVFDQPHAEGDERIYAALVEQLRAGHGYTLQGHAILGESWMISEQYDRPLFYHPPGAIAISALFAGPFGTRGLDVAQLAAFAVFFCATLGLVRELVPRPGGHAELVAVALAGFTPIVAHVSIHRWLDGPLVAAIALAAWLLARALRTGSTWGAVGAGAALGYALLVKLSAALALPGIVAVAWAAAPEVPSLTRLRALAVASAVAAACIAPWLVVELRAYGTLFPSWAGKPSARLVAENPFVHHVTAVRTPWVYLRLLPTTVWTLVPALAVLAWARPKGRTGAIAATLILWIAVVVGVNVALGAIGYSKLLRYVVPIAPAAVALAALAAHEVSRLRRPARLALAGALVVAVGLEVAHGVQAVRVHADKAWVRPLVGAPR